MLVHLPVADVVVSLPGLILLGLAVGCLAGMFGVGGGFLMTPMLRIIFGIPYNVAVGSELLQMVGTSISSTQRHFRLGNIDMKLGTVMALSSIVGTEIGVRLQSLLKSSGTLSINGHNILAQDFWMTSIFIVLLLTIGIPALLETRNAGAKKQTPHDQERPAYRMEAFVKKTIKVPPFLEFKTAGIGKTSVWVPAGIGFLVGILTGMLGVGGGFVNFPILVYVLGVPTHIAAGTSAFQIFFSASYGAIRHATESNVDILLVIFLLLGSVVGAQIGASITRKMQGIVLRRYFAYTVLFAVTIIILNFSWRIAG